MMKTQYILGIFLCILCLSCTKTKKKQHKETPPILVTKQEPQKSHQVLMQEALDRAITKVKLHLNEDVYKSIYEEAQDSAVFVTVSISIGNLFTQQERHAIIRRSDSGTVHFNIFSLHENKLQEVLYHEQWALTYISDTIRDINGDQRKDFVINGYGSSGCCLKAFSKVHLLKNNAKEFTNIFDFINPTFSPKEGIIRGICYGHPGETEMYKYKWNGVAIDTLEFIYFQKNQKGEKTGKIIRSNKRFASEKDNINQVLQKVPKEYKEIDGYDWFLGKI